MKLDELRVEHETNEASGESIISCLNDKLSQVTGSLRLILRLTRTFVKTQEFTSSDLVKVKCPSSAYRVIRLSLIVNRFVKLSNIKICKHNSSKIDSSSNFCFKTELCRSRDPWMTVFRTLTILTIFPALHTTWTVMTRMGDQATSTPPSTISQPCQGSEMV